MKHFVSAFLLFSDVLGATRGWSQVSVPSSPKVSGQSVGSLDDGTTILFGGLTGGAGSPCTDQTWELSANGAATTPHWKLLVSTKDAVVPRVRMYAASACLGNKVILFGGWDPGAPGSGGDFLDDVWEFDVTSKEWTLLDFKLPFPVSRHTACTISGSLDDDPMIVLHTFKGTLVYRDGGLSEQATTGDAPDGLSMCAVAPLTGSRMLLMGGSTKTQQMSGDAYVLDTTTWNWTKLNIINDKDKPGPPPLASACAAHLQDNTVVVVGGAAIGATGYEGGMGLIPQENTWMLQVSAEDDTAFWTKIESDSRPEGRVAASLSPFGKSSFWLQGGFDPVTKATFDEPWVLEL